MPTKVLVFESDPAFAGELRAELGNLGCSTTVVDDGNLGLQQAASDKPDLILLSIELPRMNGFSVCNKLKKDPNLKDVPLIIMSSESSDETFEQHKKLRTRAQDYVHKPIGFGDLLDHIRGFVPIGPPQSEGDGAIVIDDEIEVGVGDYVVDEDEAASGSRAMSRPSAAPRQVDADVDAFAESAFGRLTGGSQPPPAVETRGGGAVRNGSGSLPDIAPPPRRSLTPGPARALSVPPQPPAGVDAAEHARVKEELAQAKGRAAEAEVQLEEARREIDKLKIEAGESEQHAREVDELKARLAAAPKVGAVSSREFLDLRETLNKKDKEILALKEQLSKKDKEIVESQDRALAFERNKSDLDERLLSLERELAETREKNEALVSDRDLAKKAGEDHKVRLEKAKAEADGKERQLSELRRKHAEERSASEAKLAALRAEIDQTLANERAAHALALDDAEARRAEDLEQASRERDAAVAEALEAQAGRIQKEHEEKLAELASEAEAKADERISRARSESEKREAAALEALRAEHDEKIAQLVTERDSRIAGVEAKAARELREANDALAKLDMDLSAARGELGSLREAKEELERQLGDAQNIQGEQDRKLASTNERCATLEGDVESLREEVGTTKQRLAAETSRAEKANAKWEADKQSLERAKDALAVALAQIEEAEGRAG